jgi:hypothetical protein
VTFGELLKDAAVVGTAGLTLEVRHENRRVALGMLHDYVARMLRCGREQSA